MYSLYITNMTSSSLRSPVSFVVSAAIQSLDSYESQATKITDNCHGFDEYFAEIRTSSYMMF